MLAAAIRRWTANADPSFGWNDKRFRVMGFLELTTQKREVRYRPVAKRVASLGGRLAARIFSWAMRKL
jgi:hypothetical protein